MSSPTRSSTSRSRSARGTTRFTTPRRNSSSAASFAPVEHELERLRRTDEPRQPHRAAEVGHEAPVHLEQTHTRVVGRDAEIARERELHARSVRVALHLRDRGVGRGLEPAERLLDREDPVDVGAHGRFRGTAVGGRRRGREGRDVDARRERTALAGDDERADRVVGRELGADLREVVPHRDRLRVQLVGAVQRQPDDTAVPLDPDLVHGRSVAGASARGRAELPICDVA